MCRTRPASRCCPRSSQTLTLDYRDSKHVEPHSGFVIRLGQRFRRPWAATPTFVRTKVDGTYYIPLDRFTGNADWGIVHLGRCGLPGDAGNNQERIIDRFFLGGDNLRGFQTGGVGPHAVQWRRQPRWPLHLDTQSTELHYPLPISPDLGVTGRAFVDVGGLFGLQRLTVVNGHAADGGSYRTPRVGAGRRHLVEDAVRG